MRSKMLARIAIVLAMLSLPHLVIAQAGNSAGAPGSPETADLLKQLIRIDTANPPGDTLKVAEYLKTLFEPLGAQIDIVIAPNGKAAHFVARIKGDGSKQPVLIAAHSDVVPAEKEKWTVDPLVGVEKDGFIYGRGAIDFKGGLAVFATAAMRLAREKVPLARDVILLVEADEEQGQYNTHWLAKEHWDKMKAEFALNEGGYVLHDKDGVVRQVNVTTADKVSITFRLRSAGAVGHSSRPLPPMQSANGRMIAALAKLSAYDAPVKLVPQTRAYFDALARLNPGPLGAAIGRLLRTTDAKTRQTAERSVLKALPDDALRLHALLRDTMAITIIKAGFKSNVIPGEAEAVVNTRLLPGTTPDQIADELRRVINDPQISLDIVTPMSPEAAHDYYMMRTNLPASPTSTDLYQALERNAKRLWPHAEVIPALFEAGTDALAWRERGVPVYGIYPYPLDNDLLLGMHGHDERISVKSLNEGTDWIYRTLIDVAGK